MCCFQASLFFALYILSETRKLVRKLLHLTVENETEKSKSSVVSMSRMGNIFSFYGIVAKMIINCIFLCYCFVSTEKYFLFFATGVCLGGKFRPFSDISQNSMLEKRSPIKFNLRKTVSSQNSTRKKKTVFS